jgi:hypothetical protein
MACAVERDKSLFLNIYLTNARAVYEIRTFFTPKDSVMANLAID